jgi:hypothetical protein
MLGWLSYSGQMMSNEAERYCSKNPSKHSSEPIEQVNAMRPPAIPFMTKSYPIPDLRGRTIVLFGI